MSTKQIDIRFEGDGFRPSHLKATTKWKSLKILVETGEISPRGKFKGKPSPYGIAYLPIKITKESSDPFEIINNYSDKLIENKRILNESGVKNITFDIETSNPKEYTYTLESSVVKKLHELNANIDFHGNELEIALDQWIETFYNDSKNFFDATELQKLQILRNKIVHSSPHIRIYSVSHLYNFLMIYFVKYYGDEEKDIPEFEKSYLDYSSKIL